MQTNYIGYRDKITPQHKKEFERVTDSIQKNANKTNLTACFTAMQRWLALFNDAHVSITIIEDSSNYSTIRDMFKNAERVSMTETAFLNYLETNKSKTDSLEGIWENEDKNYRVALMREANKPDKLIGFILKADSLLWMPGQIKFRLKKNGSRYSLTGLAARYHNISTGPLQVNKNTIRMDLPSTMFIWHKVEKNNITKPDRENRYEAVFSRPDSNTCLLVIPTARGYQYKIIIDSLLRQYDAVIKRTPHLIIDVRDNLGGTVTSFEKIIPLLYTRPIINEGASVLSTQDNIKDLYGFVDYPGITDSLKKVFLKEADTLRAHPNSVYKLWPADTLKMDAVLPYPQKVSILINKYCASSTELFLLKARQSSKVTLYGTHTMGAVDYTDGASTKIACNLFSLRYSTSRSDNALTHPIDNIGIQPDVVIGNDVTDWVKYVIEKQPL